MAVSALRSPDAAARWLREWVRGSLRTDSRQVRPGDAFIAWPGYANDGRRWVQAALDAGATTCLVEHDSIEAFGFDDARIASLPKMKAATGLIADAYFGAPSSRLDVIAITGTNGKTSSAWWIAQALTLLGKRCGVVGTLGIGVPPIPSNAASGVGADAGDIRTTGLTTPDPVRLHEALRDFADRGFAACAMEASSIGIDEHRLAGVRVAVAVFTNFTQDHLDYHGSMDAYWSAKRKLFAWPGLRAAVINIDDAAGAQIAPELATRGEVDVWSTGLRADARLAARKVRYVDGGLAFDVVERARETAAVSSTLVGDYNVDNLLGVIGALRALGVPLAQAATVAGKVTPVPGRMQRLSDVGQPMVIVDYAHTPDALEKVLASLRPLARERGGKLVCVFGCGGDRDPAKRPLMGAAAARGADAVILTSDNPRSEAPAKILADIAAGMPATVPMIEDRRDAITRALREAAANDVVLIAGKGHEDYQEIAGQRLPFSDAAVVGELLGAMKAQAR
jgi:UDP-N-acetylmuramoyl-L-alanyl-D-glutamate--2,6-diaminopimelate ligase